MNRSLLHRMAACAFLGAFFAGLPAGPLHAGPVILTLNKGSGEIVYYPDIVEPCQSELLRFGSGQQAIDVKAVSLPGRPGRSLLVTSDYTDQVILFERSPNGLFLEGQVQPGALVLGVAADPRDGAPFYYAWNGHGTLPSLNTYEKTVGGFRHDFPLYSGGLPIDLARDAGGIWWTLFHDRGELLLRQGASGSVAGTWDFGAMQVAQARLADLDRDGDLDIFIAFSRHYAVILALPGGGFTEPVLVPLDEREFGQSGPDFETLIADFSGDGHLDVLLVGSSRDGFVWANTLLMGDGTGKFPRKARSVLPSASPRVAAGDVDGDGGIDLVQWTPGVFSVLGASEEGVFLEKGRVATTAETVNDIILDDLDADGDLDLVAADGKVRILSGDGRGRFTLSQVIEMGGAPIDFTKGSFGGDHSLEVAVLMAGTGSIKLLHWQGGRLGRFGPPRYLRTATRPHSIHAADFDGDGRLDLGVNDDAGYFFIHAGKGDGAFLDPAVTRVGRVLEAADLDGDGLVDLACRPEGTAEVALFRGTGSRFTRAGTLEGMRDPVDVAAADLDGDGRLDLAVANQVAGTLRLFRATGDLAYEALGADLETGGGPREVLAGDLDGDGLEELVSLDVWTDEVSLFRRDRDSGFSAAKRFVQLPGVDLALVRMPASDFRYEIAVLDEENSGVSIHFLKSPPRARSGCGSFFNPGLEPVRLLAVDLAGPHLQRGDAGGDGLVALNDPLQVLFGLFLGGKLPCPDAADFDDSGTLSLADAVALLVFLYREGPPPAEPFPGYGPDVTPDTLGPCLIDALSR